MRVLFVLPRIVMGGVERITLNLIGQLQAEGIECALALRRRHGELLSEAEQLTDVFEIARGGLHHFVPRLTVLIQNWRPTHIVVVFANISLLTLWARRRSRSGAVVICGVHNAPGVETARPGFFGRLRYKVDVSVLRWVYKYVDAIVTDSIGVEVEIKKIFGISEHRVCTIYNPVMNAKEWKQIACAPVRREAAVRRLVAIGRLVWQKGFDVLVAAMARVNTTQAWHLDIYGEGPDRKALTEQIDLLGLSGSITLKGYTTDPIGCLVAADVFVLSSRHEGLPTVLILALAAGIQIVSTDCPHGPSEILQGGKLGTLVRTEASSLAEGIGHALSGVSYVDPEAMRARALAFDVAHSTARWRALLESTLSQRE
jgi:glycosyltransferase involved in cell wall biosynthesis